MTVTSTRDLGRLAGHAARRGADMQLYTAQMSSVNMKDWLAGSAAFLILSGPSLNDIDISLFNRRGIVTMAVNNAWSVVRPMFWTCADPPCTFHDKGWTDPGIIKLVPIELSTGSIHNKIDGEFFETEAKAFDMPTTFFYPRNCEFNHETFLTEASVNWGTTKGGKDSLGDSCCRSVFLAALKLLIYLGAKRIYLVGCDFKMSEGREYAFDQVKAQPGRIGNNNSYKILNKRLEALLPYFEKEGVEIFNCNPSSGLLAFSSIDFEDAIRRESDSFEKEWDLADWYTQQELEASLKLPDRRVREVRKYSQIFEANDAYGHTNHGKKARKYILEVLKPKSVIDLGCGWNEFVESIREQIPESYGVDFACPGANIFAPMHNVPVSDRRFDLVTCFDALEHCITEEIPEIVAEFKRLAPQFLISISHVQARNRGVHGEPLHMTVKKVGWWVNQFRKQGARVIRVPDSNYLLGTWS